MYECERELRVFFSPVLMVSIPAVCPAEMRFVKPLLEITTPNIKINQHLGYVTSLNSSGFSSWYTSKLVFSAAEMGTAEAKGESRKGGHYRCFMVCSRYNGWYMQNRDETDEWDEILWILKKEIGSYFYILWSSQYRQFLKDVKGFNQVVKGCCIPSFLVRYIWIFILQNLMKNNSALPNTEEMTQFDITGWNETLKYNTDAHTSIYLLKTYCRLQWSP